MLERDRKKEMCIGGRVTYNSQPNLARKRKEH